LDTVVAVENSVSLFLQDSDSVDQSIVREQENNFRLEDISTINCNDNNKGSSSLQLTDEVVVRVNKKRSKRILEDSDED
jgi:hypothetical protein